MDLWNYSRHPCLTLLLLVIITYPDQAFADAYGRSVHIVTSYEDRGVIAINPQVHQLSS